MTATTTNQRAEVLGHLKNGKTINPFQAFGLFSCMRLASVIFSLRAKGHDIECEIVVERGHRVGQYKLKG